MELVLYLLIAQGCMGGFDTIYHHEWKVGLTRHPWAVKELWIHAVRAVLYGVLFFCMARLQFFGAWVWALVGLVLVEVGLTLWDFVVEDQTRQLPSSERILHTLLAINGGAVFGLFGVQLAQWHSQTSALRWVDYGWQSSVLTLFALGVFGWGVRDGMAAYLLSRP